MPVPVSEQMPLNLASCNSPHLLNLTSKSSVYCWLVCCVLLIDWWARLLMWTFSQLLVCLSFVVYYFLSFAH